MIIPTCGAYINTSIVEFAAITIRVTTRVRARNVSVHDGREVECRRRRGAEYVADRQARLRVRPRRCHRVNLDVVSIGRRVGEIPMRQVHEDGGRRP